MPPLASPSQRHLADIAGLVRAHRVPLLLGAGSSIAAGGPSGVSVGAEVLGALYPHEAHGSSLPFERALATAPAGGRVRAEGVRASLRALEPSPAHLALAELIRDGVLTSLVLTTNFDDLMETALARVGVDSVRVLDGGDVDGADDLAADHGVVSVLKVHGDMVNPGSTLRMDPATLKQLPEPLVVAVSRLVAERGLLAIGYQLRDPGLFEALTRQAPTESLVGWVGLGEPNPEVRDFLERHGCARNWSSAGFSAFVRALGDRALDAQLVSQHDGTMRELWHRFDEARSCASVREDRLDEITRRLKDSADLGQLAEAKALQALVRFELFEQTDHLALREALGQLGASFAHRRRLGPPVRVRVLGRYVQELNRAMFHGIDPDFASATGTGLAEVSQVVEEALADDADYASRQGVHSEDRAAVLLYSAEALKEMQQRSPERGGVRVQRALTCLHDALRLLGPTQPHGPDEWNRATYLRGAAERHLGVVHEYAATIPGVSQHERREHIRAMADHCQAATVQLGSLGEDTIRGYALMNWAVAEARLGSGRREEWQASVQHLEEVLERLAEAERNFRLVRDRRGLAWVHVHLCGVCSSFLDAVGERVHEDEASYVVTVLERLHRYAMMGRSWATRVDADPMPYALTTYQAARALIGLARVGRIVSDSKEAQLEQAIALATEGAGPLRETRRAFNAAHCMMIKAQAAELLARDADPEQAAQQIADAVRALADAIALLARSGELDHTRLQEPYGELLELLDSVRRRLSLTY